VRLSVLKTLKTHYLAKSLGFSVCLYEIR